VNTAQQDRHFVNHRLVHIW